MKKRSWFRILLFVAPMIIGMIGFLADGGCRLSEALFRCLTMYLMEYGDTPPNLLVDIARWLAPLATASGILFFLTAAKERIINKFRYLRGNAIAVYGPEAEQESTLRELGKKGIRGKDRFVKAERYILLGNEEENMSFYTKYEKELEKRTVYFRSNILPSQHSFSARLIPFSREEIAARTFWKEHCIYPMVKESAYHAAIVILGFGYLGEELLYWGLQENIFSPDQKIHYHIFGDCESFLRTHMQLNQISDPVHYHAEEWDQSIDVLQSASMILVVDQENQTKLLRDLKCVLPNAPVTVFCKSNELAAMEQKFWGYETFNWIEKSSVVRNILSDRIYLLAKSIHMRYQHIYSGIPETPENRETEWQKLDSFLRMSNISCADYHEIRLKMLNEMHLDPDALSTDRIELLSELEHIRWCRYYCLNNWQYGIPDDGTAKSPLLRIHQKLVPYDELTDEVKEKDRENIRVLLSIQNTNK